MLLHLILTAFKPKGHLRSLLKYLSTQHLSYPTMRFLLSNIFGEEPVSSSILKHWGYIYIIRLRFGIAVALELVQKNFLQSNIFSASTTLAEYFCLSNSSRALAAAAIYCSTYSQLKEPPSRRPEGSKPFLAGPHGLFIARLRKSPKFQFSPLDFPFYCPVNMEAVILINMDYLYTKNP